MNYYVEKYGPVASAAVTVFTLWYFKGSLTIASSTNEVDFSTLYSSVFDWSAIQTGFIFGIFGFVGGKSTAFISKVQSTESMKLFLGYTKSAMFLGFLVTFISIPLIVSGFKMHLSTVTFVMFCAWCSISIWAFFAFARVAYIFGLLIRPKDNERLPA